MISPRLGTNIVSELSYTEEPNNSYVLARYVDKQRIIELHKYGYKPIFSDTDHYVTMENGNIKELFNGFSKEDVRNLLGISL